MTKPPQTALLLLTGFAGYASARPVPIQWTALMGFLGSLLLAIAGSTVLNMVYDRDIDARMKRTAGRPLPSGRIGVTQALVVGALLSVGGLVWAASLSLLYATVVLAGLFFDVAVYTLWLKRRTAWSIVWGGLSGGMPILAGRVLGSGRLDLIGLLLAASVVLWIPTHILTFCSSSRYYRDYLLGGIPTFPGIYGRRNTRLIVAVASIGAAVAIGTGCIALGLAWGYVRLLAVLAAGIVGLALVSIYRPSDEINFGLFKYASFYMLGSMLMVVLGSLK